MMLYEILSDLLTIEDLLFVLKNSSATSEVKSASLTIKQKDKWITLGENDDPAHIHINSEMIKSIKFIQEEKPERISFSVRFFDENNERVLGVFFTKMYDAEKNLIELRKKSFDELSKKYGSLIFL